MQILQTRQTLLNPTLLGKFEFPEPILSTGLGTTDSAIIASADSGIIQAGFEENQASQLSHLRLQPSHIHISACASRLENTLNIRTEVHAQTDADNHILLGPIIDAQSQACLPNSSEFLVNQMISPANRRLHMRPRPWRSKRCREASNEFMQLRSRSSYVVQRGSIRTVRRLFKFFHSRLSPSKMELS